MSQYVQWFVNRWCSFSLEVVIVGRQILNFLFLAPQTLPLLLNIFWHFFRNPLKQSQCDVLLLEPWNVGMPSCVEIPVVSNVGWEADRHLWKYNGKQFNGYSLGVRLVHTYKWIRNKGANQIINILVAPFSDFVNGTNHTLNIFFCSASCLSSNGSRHTS